MEGGVEQRELEDEELGLSWSAIETGSKQMREEEEEEATPKERGGESGVRQSRLATH